MAEAPESERLLGESGLPEVSEEERAKSASEAKILLAVLMTAPRLLGFGVAFAIFWFGDKKSYKDQIGFLTEKHLGFLYLSAVVFSAMVQWLNAFPMFYKSQLNIKGNLRANMTFFKMNTKEAIMGKSMPFVVMEEDGLVGEYNRANRSLFHFNENMGGVLACLLLSGFVFPLPVFICAVIFATGRVIHQVGYAVGYGKHAPGFMLAVLTTATLEGLVTVAAASSFGAF
mmetsp:Transcript_94380/g.270661  ORF Transcript_94380/g.270661 Transcript_94380/m.270661 type:complete len:229 (-) Transcript_94380:416-1102(-)